MCFNHEMSKKEMMMNKEISDKASAEEKLDSFSAADRLKALKWLAANACSELPEQYEQVNMHVHSFFSYNTKGYSPSHIAWQARNVGL